MPVWNRGFCDSRFSLPFPRPLPPPWISMSAMHGARLRSGRSARVQGFAGRITPSDIREFCSRRDETFFLGPRRIFLSGPNFPLTPFQCRGSARNIPAADDGQPPVTSSKFHSSLCTVGMQQYLLALLAASPVAQVLKRISYRILRSGS
jgi:hypothetical protein